MNPDLIRTRMRARTLMLRHAEERRTLLAELTAANDLRIAGLTASIEQDRETLNSSREGARS